MNTKKMECPNCCTAFTQSKNVVEETESTEQMGLIISKFNVRVKCIYHNKGCDFVAKFQNFNQIEKDLAEHESKCKKCSECIAKCTVCSKFFLNSEIDEHTVKCLKEKEEREAKAAKEQKEREERNRLEKERFEREKKEMEEGKRQIEPVPARIE